MKLKVAFSKTDPARVSLRDDGVTFRRRITLNGVEQAFDLGHDEIEARHRALKIFRFVEELKSKNIVGWDDGILGIAKAIARGQDRVELELTMATGISFEGTYHTGSLIAEAFDQHRINGLGNSVIPVKLKTTERQKTGTTLHEAIDAFAAHVRREIVAAPEPGREQQVSPWGSNLAKEVERLKRSHDDIALADFGYTQIESMANYWAKRPMKKGTESPVKVKTVRNQLKTLRRFIHWVGHTHSWNAPQSWLTATAKKGKLSDDEKAAKKNRNRVPTFSKSQVELLYRYCTPRERLLLMLSICCGYGAAEISSLRIDDLHLNTSGHSYIKRIRGKETVYGEHWVCSELREALEWALEIRKKQIRSKAGADISWNLSSKVVLRESGEPLCKLTPAGNVTNNAAAMWARLVQRVRKDEPGFPSLSFGKLRKTGSDWIPRAGSGEMAKLFLIHGNSMEGIDDNLPNYTNEDFKRLFKFQRKLHRKRLAAIFASVANPFPTELKRGGNNISLGTVERICSLWASGESAEKIADLCGVSRSTVYLHRPSGNGLTESAE